METRRFLTAAGLLVAVLCGVSNAGAQVIFGEPASGSTQFIYNSWSTEYNGYKTTLSQFLTPFTGFVPLRENFDLTLFAATSGNNLEGPIGEVDLSGFSDVRLQARHSFAKDRLLAAVGLNLPTGKRKLDLVGEWGVMQELSTNYYELPMRRFGEGFGFTLLFGGATMLGETIKLGAGVSYQFIGEYEPYEIYDTAGASITYDYNPGDIISLNTRGEIENGPWRWTADIVYGLYTTDQVNGVETFRQSPQADFRLQVNHAGEIVTYGGLVRYVLRGDNDVYDTTGTEVASLKLYGDEFSLGGYLSWVVSEGWTVTPSADVRMIGSNDALFDNSTVVGIGAAVGKSFTKHFSMDAGLKFYTGTASFFNSLGDDTEIDADVAGLQLTLGLTAAL